MKLDYENYIQREDDTDRYKNDHCVVPNDMNRGCGHATESCSIVTNMRFYVSGNIRQEWKL